MDLQIDCRNIQISPNTDRWITASIDGAEANEVLNHFRISDIVEHFGLSEIIEHIGQAEVEKYFDLVPNETE